MKLKYEDYDQFGEAVVEKMEEEGLSEEDITPFYMDNYDLELAFLDCETSEDQEYLLETYVSEYITNLNW